MSNTRNVEDLHTRTQQVAHNTSTLLLRAKEFKDAAERLARQKDEEKARQIEAEQARQAEKEAQKAQKVAEKKARADAAKAAKAEKARKKAAINSGGSSNSTVDTTEKPYQLPPSIETQKLSDAEKKKLVEDGQQAIQHRIGSFLDNQPKLDQPDALEKLLATSHQTFGKRINKETSLLTQETSPLIVPQPNTQSIFKKKRFWAAAAVILLGIGLITLGSLAMPPVSVLTAAILGVTLKSTAVWGISMGMISTGLFATAGSAVVVHRARKTVRIIPEIKVEEDYLSFKSFGSFGSLSSQASLRSQGIGSTLHPGVIDASTPSIPSLGTLAPTTQLSMSSPTPQSHLRAGKGPT